MPSDSAPEAPWLNATTTPLLVGDGPDARPFMSGILVASLLESGLPFTTCYSTALEVELQFQERRATRVQTQEISAAVLSVLGHEPGSRISDVDRDIVVVGKSGGLPFSKGLLSQSLLAAAIDPVDAFEVARAIERDLVADHLGQISRSDLRRHAHRALSTHAGQEAGARYLAWRRYEEPSQPVIILLGGTSGVGKTTLALEVARRMGIGRVLSTDSIRQVMRLMISRDLMPWIHASSYEAGHLFSRETEPEIRVLDGFRAQATSVAVGVQACIDRSVEESANLVVDGVSLLPGVIDLERYRGRAIIVFCVVATRDEAALGDRFQVRASGQPQRMATRYLENLDGILTIQRHLIDEAAKQGIPVVDNIDLDRSAAQIIAHVLDTVRDDPLHAAYDDRALAESAK